MRRRPRSATAGGRASAGRPASGRRGGRSGSRRGRSRRPGDDARSRRGRGSRSRRRRRGRSGRPAEPGDRQVALDPALRRAHLRQAEPAGLRGEPVRAQPVEERRRAPGPETSNFAKLVWSSTPTAERTARHSRADGLVPVAAPEGVGVLGGAVAGEPQRAAPIRSAPRTRPRAQRGGRRAARSSAAGRPGRSSSGKWMSYSRS